MDSENSTIEKLNKLAEFQAQIDFLEMRKKELLDAVKIPDEVLAAQDEANRRRQAAEDEALRIQKDIQETTAMLMREVINPELPEEYLAAMADAQAQRDTIQSQATARYEALAKKKAEKLAKIEAELRLQVGEIYEQVETRKTEIDVEFSGKADAAKRNIEQLTAEIKADIVEIGHSVKGALYQAVYQKGRVTWNTDMLDGMIIAYPALAKARKEGSPSVALRRIG